MKIDIIALLSLQEMDTVFEIFHNPNFLSLSYENRSKYKC